MPRKSKNVSKPADWEAMYDLPSELDFSKLRVVGVGVEALRKHAAGKRKVVALEPDVAKDFPTAKAVNDGLRMLREIQRMVGAGRKRKTA